MATPAGVTKHYDNTRLVDDAQLQLGTDNDAQVYHDGTNLNIKLAAGTGDVLVKLGNQASTSKFEIQDSAGGALFAISADGAQVMPGDIAFSDSSTVKVSGSSGTALTLTLDSINSGAGAGNTVVTADDSVKIGDAGNPTIDFPGSGAVTMTGNPTTNFGTGQATFGGNLDVSNGVDVTGTVAASSAIGVKASLAHAQPTSALIAASFVAGEGDSTPPDVSLARTSANVLSLAAGDTLQADTIGETTAGSGITLQSGVEILGVPKTVSFATSYNMADGTAFAVPAGEVWVISEMYHVTSVNWDGNGAFIVGDATDADGYLTLANASLQTTYDESGGIAGWPTGSRGLDSANRGVYLTTAVTLNGRSIRAVGPYNVVIDNTQGTSTAGSGRLYMTYTRLV
jgi:hypothetical protein